MESQVIRPLNPKQRRFVAEYLKDQNGTQAAIRAGYSKRTANEQAAELLAIPRIRAAVDAKLDKIMTNAGITQERVLKALLNIAELDPRMLFNPDGTVKMMSELPDSVALAISSIESDNLVGDIKKLKFWDKVKALELLGKHVKLFDENVTLSGIPMVLNIVPAPNPIAPDPGH
jgi:phage terminase small subunit